MRIDLKGTWNLRLDPENVGETQHWELPWTKWDGTIEIPGCLQGQGYGEDISLFTPWVSGLHDPLWYQREEYAFGARGEGKDQTEGIEDFHQVLVPFLSQPPKHYIGKAWYQREFRVEAPKGQCQAEGPWTFRAELARWVSHVWVDGGDRGEDFSLCAAHEIPVGFLEPGVHIITVCLDTTLRYPYRPDSHTVSDALGATWNGMAGEVALLDQAELISRSQARGRYAAAHPRYVAVQKIEGKGGLFYVDGQPEYFRGTHFGGECPRTGYPSTDISWWQRIMRTIRDWGLNFIRFHSFCPPEAAFLAADQENIYLQVECGMWNIFQPGIPMLSLLRGETEKILRQFGHHPSFVLFSPSNEPGGDWYEPLRQWVADTKEYDRKLGYEGRRLYTAQSGWFYDVPPEKVEGTDYLYFHRSAYGPYVGGAIRNSEGWKGKDYGPSLKGCQLPVICHELGQWCAYPDFSIIHRFTGYLRPGNYTVFRELAKRKGLLSRNRQFAFCSGKNQVMMYKEDLEANFRTPSIYGFELLDIHDYLGQGTAPVGVLDAFWEEKGYVRPKEWREFCGEMVLLARIPSYVVKNTQTLEIPLEVCCFGASLTEGEAECKVLWSFTWEPKAEAEREEETGTDQAAWREGCFSLKKVEPGKNIPVGVIRLDFSGQKTSAMGRLQVWCGEYKNHWDLYVYAEREIKNQREPGKVLYTRSWQEAKEALRQGRRVVFSPYLSSLGYQCPPASLKPVFWNGQMGPGWTRGMGMVCEENHPVFCGFPTKMWGGWQWEDILSHARGMDISGFPEAVCHMVRLIDDWNRGLPLSLMFECRMGEGRLLTVSAALEGSFALRPAAYCLKQSILEYAASQEFEPQTELRPQALERLFFPNHQMARLPLHVLWGAKTKVEGAGAVIDGTPNTAVHLEKEEYPIRLVYHLDRPISVKGMVYMADQRDRLHEGDIREYEIRYRPQAVSGTDSVCQEECPDPSGGGQSRYPLAARGRLLSTVLPQEIRFSSPVITAELCFDILSGYGGAQSTWQSEEEGWYLRESPKVKKAAFSILSLITEEPAGQEDDLFSEKTVRSGTKEIDD